MKWPSGEWGIAAIEARCPGQSRSDPRCGPKGVQRSACPSPRRCTRSNRGVQASAMSRTTGAPARGEREMTGSSWRAFSRDAARHGPQPQPWSASASSRPGTPSSSSRARRSGREAGEAARASELRKDGSVGRDVPRRGASPDTPVAPHPVGSQSGHFRLASAREARAVSREGKRGVVIDGTDRRTSRDFAERSI